ncbi:MAG: UDP-N-acetylmuramoyl-L-alanyl-D-glutamate--2,6-diaminopimelate ligase [Clostridia bacterium]|nr:UDP-N-acetylmuramoyl-L-alanyl-D-glutamate--2,6-diaminopimelate ligase [Clostridia bacterium]
MKLRQLLSGVETAYMNADPDAEVKDVVNHSDKAEKGTVFAALCGEREDGYGYIKKALERGCELILCDRMPYLPCGYIVAANAHKAYAHMCAALRCDPQSRLKMFAVTGTNGKTTVTHMLRHIFGKAYGDEKTALIGGVNDYICGSVRESDMTTPDPHELYRLLADAVCAGGEYAFLEASSHALDYEKLDPCRFEVGIFTNLTEDHLDHHGTMESYFESKQKLIPLCKTVLANNDNEYTKTLRCLKFSLYEGDFVASDVIPERDGSRFIYNKNTEIILKTPGLFNVYNALCAVAAAELSGVAPEASASALLDFKGAEGRYERIACINGADVIIDYAHTPDALLSALCTAKRTCEGSLWCVFGCGGDRDPEKRPVMGRIASEYADCTVVTSDNSRSEDPLKIIESIMQGFDKEKRYAVIPDRREAILYALENTGKGDVVLLAGKGHEKYEIDSNGKRPFSEKDIIKEFNCKGTL